MQVPRSGVRDIAWPALPDELNARMLALQFQYEETERWAPADIEAQQFQQIGALLNFCHTAIPFWRDRLRKAGLRPGQKLNRQIWSRLPILTRREAQEAGAKLRPAQLPDGHGQARTGATSGSTGMPLRYARSEIAHFLFLASNLRLMLWHGRDMTQKVATIRLVASGGAVPQGVETAARWGEGYEAFPTGPAIRFDMRLPPARQVEILRQEAAAYIIALPSNAAQLAQYCRETGTNLPSLRGINTYGEVLSDDSRAICQEVFGCRVADAYSTEELGYVAIQCPAHNHHHVLAETALVEILDAAGRPCAPSFKIA